MKKLFTSLTALALVSAMVVPMAAFAENQELSQTEFPESIDAVGQVAPTYTISIPSSVTIGESSAVAIENVVTKISSNCALTVTATLTNDGAVYAGTTFPTSYASLSSAGTFEISDYTYNFSEGDTETFKAYWASNGRPTTAGIYAGQITFNVTTQ